METTFDELCMRIERLEADLAAATLEIHRVRDAPKRRRAAYSAVVTAFAVIIAASWTVRAQTPTRIPGTPEEQILSLLRRVTALEQRSTARVKAPFEVVDDGGKIIFAVLPNPRMFVLLTAAQALVASGTALDTGGIFKTINADRSAQASIGVSGKVFAGVSVRQGEKQRGVLGIAADGRATLELSADSGTVVSHLGQGASGGGVLQLANAGGNAQVEAGVLGSGAGIVRTFPNGNPGAGLVGMPGTFIMGRPGGDLW